MFSLSLVQLYLVYKNFQPLILYSAAVYTIYITILLSFIPTPILIVVFLKPVRKGLRRLLCNKYKKDNETIHMQQAEKPL